MSAPRTPVARVDEFETSGDRIIEDVNGQEIAVFYVDGEFYAVANYCIHEGGPLCEGELSGTFGLADDGYNWTYDDELRLIHCPWHNWKFDITDGVCPDDDMYRVPTYDVEVEDGTVYVNR